ncbi:molybdopterin oxidoreductase [Cellulomonas triticagri]|uniref:Molybdopterin oxidoreductase n=1 Tax=Cellulomonas triticagri TaxID=2483352 RepID=A0A3M2JQY0_9CELL|nr:molybdopterin oxidoreductase [Cellulomonas triticagri]RMI12628.1 molybdopterin oxidoreductase [Cellulomonas triticagri]
MSAHQTRTRTRHSVPWWVLCAWGSLVLLVLGGLAAASGVL